jgi:hypothetical protein
LAAGGLCQLRAALGDSEGPVEAHVEIVFANGVAMTPTEAKNAA